MPRFGCKVRGKYVQWMCMRQGKYTCGRAEILYRYSPRSAEESFTFFQDKRADVNGRALPCPPWLPEEVCIPLSHV